MNGLQVTHRLTVLWPLAHPHTHTHIQALSHMYIMHICAGRKSVHDSPSSHRGQSAHSARASSTCYSYFNRIRSHLSFIRICCPIVHVFSPETQALLCVLVMSSLPGLLIDRHTEPWVGMMVSEQQHHVNDWGLVTENTLGTLAVPQVARSEMSHRCCWALRLVFQQVAKQFFFFKCFRCYFIWQTEKGQNMFKSLTGYWVGHTHVTCEQNILVKGLYITKGVIHLRPKSWVQENQV